MTQGYLNKDEELKKLDLLSKELNDLMDDEVDELIDLEDDLDELYELVEKWSSLENYGIEKNIKYPDKGLAYLIGVFIKGFFGGFFCGGILGGLAIKVGFPEFIGYGFLPLVTGVASVCVAKDDYEFEYKEYKDYRKAVKYYRKAVKYYTNNHVKELKKINSDIKALKLKIKEIESYFTDKERKIKQNAFIEDLFVSENNISVIKKHLLSNDVKNLEDAIYLFLHDYKINSENKNYNDFFNMIQKMINDNLK